MKKKSYHEIFFPFRKIKKDLLILKLLLWFILFSMLNVSGSISSQSATFDLSVDGKTVKEVFKDIEVKNLDNFQHADDFMAFKQNIPNKTSLQQTTVTGTVTDASTGEPLPGVTIIISGTTIGTVSGIDGEYTLTVPGPDAVLVFSFVGYESQTTVAGDRNVIDISLDESVTLLDEVVAVGYGSQIRSNITGSVEDIRQERIRFQPVMQTSEALQGALSSIDIRQTGGAPGRESPSIRIRGFQTFSGAGNEPLVLIDGVPGSIDNVNPNDIESISVLKDAASAAIYGSRAANGVILIQTSQGEAGEMVITYTGSTGIGVPQELTEFADSWEYAISMNEAYQRLGAGLAFSEEEIQKFRSGELPNDRHYEMMFDNHAWQHDHNFSVSGGTETNQYMVSLGYSRKDGLLQNNLYDTYRENRINWFDRYRFRVNVNNELHEKLNVQTNISGSYSQMWAPAAFTGDGTLERLITRLTRQPSSDPARVPAGDQESTTGYFYAHVDRGTAWASIDSENHEDDRNWDLQGRTALTYAITNSLSITGIGAYTYNDNMYKQFRSHFIVQPYLIQSPSRLQQNTGKSNEVLLEALLRYNNTFNDIHSINIIAGASQTEHRYEWINAYRDDFPSNLLWQLSAASTANQRSNGSAHEWALRSYFARASYSYEGKYLVEGNIRYDGSSRFAKENRFGLFPSFSAGWRISEESFLQEGLPWLHNLMLRASYGQLGNQQIGVYPYQATINLGQQYVFGNSVVDGAKIGVVPNRDVTWETTSVTNVGIDLSVLRGQLNMSVEHFNKTTRDILYSISTAGVLGMSSAAVNAGEVGNTGWDFKINYNGSIGNFMYGLSPFLSTVKTEVLSLEHVDRDIGMNLFVGEALNVIYGYEADGLFVDQADIDSYYTQPYDPVPGDIRYKDLNGDGIVTPDDDRKVIGQTTPKYTYGGNLNIGYRNIYFSATFYGAGGMIRTLENYAARAFANKSGVQKWMFNNRWTPENPDRDAKYPLMKLHDEGRSDPYSWHSTYWAWDASFLKIKNIQLAYDLPSSIIEPAGISSLRVYFSGRNLFSFHNFFPGWDPEMLVESAQGGRHYQNTKVYSIGVNLQF